MPTASRGLGFLAEWADCTEEPQGRGTRTVKLSQEEGPPFAKEGANIASRAAHLPELSFKVGDQQTGAPKKARASVGLCGPSLELGVGF